MNKSDFLNVIKNFAISAPELDREKVVFELSDGEIYEICLVLNTDLSVSKVVENREEYSARSYITKRLARLPILANAIKRSIKPLEHFIAPNGEYELNWDISLADCVGTGNVFDVLKQTVMTDAIYETRVAYLTSNAGGGKTTLIEKLVADYAQAYHGDADKLIVPISLSGKPLLTFDDFIVSTLANRFKFTRLFYEAFIELVKLGYIIPAFDGFEEMFVASPAGAAVSAMNDLLKDLEGRGTVIVAARSAYYEYQNSSIESRIYDGFRDHSVSFSKINIGKWEHAQFLEYGERCGFAVDKIERLYEDLSNRFGANHAVITRPVLAQKVFDVYKDGDIKNLLATSDVDNAAFLNDFVFTLLQRETSKWLDNSNKSVLTIEQHCSLLSLIAQEMWVSKTEILAKDLLELIADLFIEDNSLGAEAARQVKTRIYDHAFIKIADADRHSLQFDHQDFYQYFLGKYLVTAIEKQDFNTVFDIARRDRFPRLVLETAAFDLSKKESSINTTVLTDKFNFEQKASFAKENVALLLLYLNQYINKEISFYNVSFEAEPFNSLRLSNCTFNDCIFASFNLSVVVGNVSLNNCSISNLFINDGEQIPRERNIIFDKNVYVGSFSVDEGEEVPARAPAQIKSRLKKIEGVHITESVAENDVDIYDPDPQTKAFEKVLRVFSRRIAVNSDVLNNHLGSSKTLFWKDVYPGIQNTVIKQIQYSGGGNQERYKIIRPIEELRKILSEVNGSFDEFLQRINKDYG